MILLSRSSLLQEVKGMGNLVVKRNVVKSGHLRKHEKFELILEGIEGSSNHDVTNLRYRLALIWSSLKRSTVAFK